MAYGYETGEAEKSTPEPGTFARGSSRSTRNESGDYQSLGKWGRVSFAGKLLTFFGLNDAAQLDIIYEEEETSASQEVSVQPSQEEGETPVSASPEEDLWGGMTPDLQAPPRAEASPKESLPNASTPAPTLTTSRLWRPRAPT